MNLDESVLDESVLDESILDESLLDESVLDESVLDEIVLDEMLLSPWILHLINTVEITFVEKTQIEIYSFDQTKLLRVLLGNRTWHSINGGSLLKHYYKCKKETL